MAGSITVTSSGVTGGAGVRKYSVAWTSDAAGAVSGTTFEMPPGTVVAVTTTPGSGGTQPSDLYDLTVLCSTHGTDVLNGEGANLSNATSAHKVPFIGNSGGTSFVRQWLHGGDYQPVIANAGNAKTGSFDVYVAPGVL